MNHLSLSILLVEDSPPDARLLQESLREVHNARADFHWVQRLGEALDCIMDESPDLVLLDLGLPDTQGLETLAAVHDTAPEMPIIVMTGLDDEKMAFEAVREGAQDYLVKGQVDGEAIWRTMRYAVERKQAQDALRQREEQLRQAQKMEAIGRLAGGVAHDFNNLLTAIMGYTEFLREGLPVGTEQREDAEEIYRAAERGASLTRQLLAFSRKQVLQPAVLDLNSVVEEMDKLLRRVIGEHIDLVCVLDRSLGSVVADRTQLEQVLVNLAVNARDAMLHGGKISIRTSERELSAADAREYEDLEAGHYVELRVSDTGTGMDAETRERLFEPFFTTKGQGKGTGLGLATVYGIVKQSGGDIAVESAPGQGSTFRILLPQAEAPADSSENPEFAQDMPRGTENVLLVEDEEAVRSLASRSLIRAGYRVTTAGDAEEALEALEDGSGPFDMLLTDVVLPSISGGELAGIVRRRSPGTSILCISGFMDNAVVREGVLDAGLPFLQKPFTPRGLALRVREVLDNERPA